MKSLSLWRASAVLFAALLSIATLHPHRAAAEGAIAVGEPKDVAKDGYAYGYSTGKADLKAATAEALETCRKPGNGKSEQGRKLCKTVGTFTNDSQSQRGKCGVQIGQRSQNEFVPLAPKKVADHQDFLI